MEIAVYCGILHVFPVASSIILLLVLASASEILCEVASRLFSGAFVMQRVTDVFSFSAELQTPEAAVNFPCHR